MLIPMYRRPIGPRWVPPIIYHFSSSQEGLKALLTLILHTQTWTDNTQEKRFINSEFRGQTAWVHIPALSLMGWWPWADYLTSRSSVSSPAKWVIHSAQFIRLLWRLNELSNDICISCYYCYCYLAQSNDDFFFFRKRKNMFISPLSTQNISWPSVALLR